MPYDGDDLICHTYGVDILEGKDVSVEVDLTSASRTGLWNATHILGDDSLFAINELRGNALMKIAGGRAFNRESQAIWAKHQDGKDPNGPMTRVERTAVYRDLCELITKACPPESVDQAIAGLKAQFETLGGVDD